MDPFLYKPLFLHLAVLFSIFEVLRPTRDTIQIPRVSVERNKILLWSIFLILWIGLRPVSHAFGDTLNYGRSYQAMAFIANFDVESDVLFYAPMHYMARSGFDVHLWFLLIEAVYIGGFSYTIYKLFPYRAGTVLAATLASFSFFSFSVNGIRNGMACALFVVALAQAVRSKWWLCGIFCFLAINIHKSILLPTGALVLATFYHNTKAYIAGWVACIALAVVAGGFFENLFISQGLIDTGKDMAYLSNEYVDMSQFSNTGFRYDFLLYGCVPILVGYYYVVKKKFNDRVYAVLLNVYIICNSFWVLVNRNWLSNRIAFLSWFMYTFVLLYPLLMSPYVKGRKMKVSCAVLGNAAFSYIMWIIGKYM